MYAKSIMLNNLFKNFLDIINNDQYLITCAKYYSSSMNDACTTCLANIVGPPCKSHMANCVLFEKENDFHMTFGSAAGQLTWESAHEVHLNYNI